MTARLHGAGVLAGAYRGRDLSDRTILIHAVSDAPIRVGRLARGAGEALCDRSLDLVDPYGWVGADRVDCPRCRVIVARWSAAGDASNGR